MVAPPAPVVVAAAAFGAIALTAAIVAGMMLGAGPSAAPAPDATSASAPASAIASASPAASPSPAVATATSGRANPLVGRALYRDPQSTAARAAAADPAFSAIGTPPSAIWLTPEAFPASRVGDRIRQVQADAAATGAVPVFVVYGIPNRDCSNYSAGGVRTDAAYATWTAAIGAAVHDAVVILEPDALPLIPRCVSRGERVAQIRSALDGIAPSGVPIYLHAGQAGWHSVDEMAGLLAAVGTDRLQGFATNVSGFSPTDAERRYDAQLSAATGGLHYVIDTSRNGNGSNGEWCNPSGRALGETPRVVADGTGLDALLWIKIPGESDGTCNGGPAAGEWWPAGARALIAGR